MSDDSGSTGGTWRWPHYPMYATALQQARASGDVEQMREAVERARQEPSDDPEVQTALRDVEAELARLGGSGEGHPSNTLYAVAMQRAAASGDVQQMRELIRRAETEGADDPEIQSALGDLRAALSRAGGS
jgi:ribosomal 50S subunit-associated protein YjgA (DUF615 family)